MSFGAFIRKRREEKGVPMNTFAHRIGVSPSYWSRVERDMEKPPKDNLILGAAQHLEVSADDAFVEAQRLPPDIREDLRELVRLYRQHEAGKKEWAPAATLEGIGRAD